MDRERLVGSRMLEREAQLPSTKMKEMLQLNLEHGLASAASIRDRTIPLFNRTGLRFHHGGTFTARPFLRDMRELGGQDVAIVGAPFDAGTTYRPGTRFGPQAMRAMSALDSGYNFEMGVDLWESLDIVDVGDVTVIPANIEKTFDQIDKAVGYIHERAVFPVVLGGDHSIGYPDIRGIAAVHRRQHRHHPLRPPHRPVGVQLRRADARHALLPRHQHPERPGHQSGPDRHRRLDRQSRRDGGGPRARARPSSP